MISSIGQKLLLAWVNITNTQQPANLGFGQIVRPFVAARSTVMTTKVLLPFPFDGPAQIAFNTSFLGLEGSLCLWPGLPVRNEVEISKF